MAKITFIALLLLEFFDCGFAKLIHPRIGQKPQKEGLIVGGTKAYSGQFRYQVSLRDSTGFHFCGGSIYSAKWIITAAHCIDDKTTDDLFVVVGTILTTSGTIYPSSKLIYHHGYVKATATNDIGLVKTLKSIVYTKFIQPIALASSYTEGNVTAVVSGWGNTYTDGGAPTNLLYVFVKSLTNDECRDELGDYEGKYVHDNVICTYVPGKKGICQGDSGGPLVVKNKLIGIASWVINCGGKYPDAFVRVSSHRAWIITNAV